MKIISTGAADILLVEVPNGATDFRVVKDRLFILADKSSENWDERRINLPEGYNYTILDRAKELTKLECKSIVKFVGLPWCAYKDYTTPRNWHSSPVRSFHSFLKSQGILLENPYEKPHPLQVLALGTTKYIALDSEWQEAQSKVKNPLVIKAEKI